jgi:HD-GYP domain-containing protein (c-di-GMP phosphodiesterase class II)
VRLTDLLTGLSRLADLGFGLPPGESVRSAALAVLLARSLDLPEDEVRAGLYTALLFHVGCVGFAHETARLFGDEYVTNLAAERADLADTRDVLTTLIPALIHGRHPRERVRVALVALTRGKRFGQAYDTASCEVGRDAARRLGLSETVQRSVYHSSEWWNGGGAPMGLAGDDIPMGARLAALSSITVHLDAMGGSELAVEAARRRGGGILDPELAGAFAERAEALLGELRGSDPAYLVAATEPSPVVSVMEPELLEVAAVFGDVADVKTPATYGHSRGVAALARAAGERLGRDAGDLDDLEVAASLQDVGRVAISNMVWEKPGRLDTDEWEQVRLHAYHSERILAGSQRLAPLARLVGTHHERSDGSGYHRGCTATEVVMPARILAAADAYQAMTEDRPHRAALTADQAAQQLLDDARRGLLDVDAVDAVLAAAGHTAIRVRRRVPAGLTDREVEVLRLVAEGCSNPQIAERLVVSRRTAESHVQNIYAKIGISSRAAAALFAMEHQLLGPEDP